jgi:hypothetical protein
MFMLKKALINCPTLSLLVFRRLCNLQRCNLRILFLVVLFVFSSIVFCQEKVDKPWRDVLGEQGLTQNDEKDLGFLDRIIVSRSATQEEFTQIIQIIKVSDSQDVACQALATLSNFSDVPDFVITEITKLSTAADGAILTQLSLVLGKLAIPKTFPTFFSLRTKPFSGISNNIIALLHRFGIESLAGLPLILPIFHLPNGRCNPTSFYINYFYKLPQYCISVTCNGLGIIIPYIPCQLPHDLFSELGPKPSLPVIKKMLADLKKRPRLPTWREVKLQYQNFELPEGKVDRIDGGYETRNGTFGSSISALFYLLGVQVEFKDGIEGKDQESFSYEAENKSYGQMLDEIFSMYGLKGIPQGEKIIIFKKDAQEK